MEDQVQEELKDLCARIAADTGPKAVIESLTEVQMLYEKLLVLNYLQEAREKSTPPPAAPEPPEAKTVSVSPPAAASGEVDPINASPVAEHELQDDLTPREKKIPVPETRGSASLNDQLAENRLRIGLNDRIAFVKHLFGGEQEDFNRVLSQLNTFEDLQEAESFIEQMVKPDYDWRQKEEYEMRFRHLLRQRFGG